MEMLKHDVLATFNHVCSYGMTLLLGLTAVLALDYRLLDSKQSLRANASWRGFYLFQEKAFFLLSCLA